MSIISSKTMENPNEYRQSRQQAMDAILEWKAARDEYRESQRTLSIFMTFVVCGCWRLLDEPTKSLQTRTVRRVKVS